VSERERERRERERASERERARERASEREKSKSESERGVLNHLEPVQDGSLHGQNLGPRVGVVRDVDKLVDSRRVYLLVLCRE